MSASFPILERFTDQLGWMRKGLAVMLGGFLLSPLAIAARTETRKERTASRAKSLPAFLKAECPGDTSVECWNAVAVRLAREGKLEEARQAIELAFQADPRLIALRGNLEKVYANLARQAYDSALGLTQAAPPVDLAVLPRPTSRSKSDRLAQAPVPKAAPAPKAPVVEPRTEIPVAKPAPAPLAAPPVVAGVVPAPAVRPETPPVVKPVPAEPAKAVVAEHPKPIAKPVVPVAPARGVVSTPSIPKPAPLVAVRKDTGTVVRPASASEIPPRVLPRPRPTPVDTVARTPSRTASAKLRKDSVRAARAEVRKRPDPAADRQAVRKALEAWAAHWSAKDVEGYLSWYAPSFVPANGSERSAWESLRRERLTTPASIEVKIESLHLESEDSGRVLCQFLQSYRTEAVKLRSRKHLLWERIGSDWKIVSEGEAK